MQTLILGGARSGKSGYAEQCAKQSAAQQVVYIATARATDEEMQQRIKRHQLRRPEHWQTIESPTKLATTIQQHAKQNRCLLVDCLTLWLSNIMFDQQGNLQETILEEEVKALSNSLQNLPGEIILVSNEIGSGVIAMDQMTRRFVDQVGLIHQQLATICDRVILVTAGLPHMLKP